MKTRLAVVTAVAASTIVVVLGGAVQTAFAVCSGGTGSVAEPQLIGVTVNQGLGSYGNLVRGKSALVKGYWSLPSCMAPVDASGQPTNGAYIQVNSETLTVKNGTATLGSVGTTPATLGPVYPVISNVMAAPGNVNAPADAEFIVPGSMLTPTATTAFTAGFELTITYQVKPDTATALRPPVTKTFTSLSGSTAAITKPVAKKTNALPILVVPMGFAPDAATTAMVESAMQSASRAFPVPDGIGPLNGSAGGLRYAISGSYLNLADLLTAGSFCGNSTNFTAVKTRLSAFLQAWNQSPATTTLSANATATATTITVASGTGLPAPTAPAFARIYVDNELMKLTARSGNTLTVTRAFEGTTAATHNAGAPVTLSTNQAQRAIGVVNAANSSNASGCFEGYASTATPQAWFRAGDRGTAVFAMELAHTFNVVPNFIGTARNARSDGASHSNNPNADVGVDANRAYNIRDASFLYDDHSAMKWVDGILPSAPAASLVTGPWNGDRTVFEAADYATLLCKLGGPATADCAAAAQPVGTNVGVAAAPAVEAFAVTGDTDGTAAGTHVAYSTKITTVTTLANAASAYRLVQKQGTAVARNDGVPVSFEESVHGAVHDHVSSTNGSFSVAYPSTSGVDGVELWKVPVVNGTPAAPGSAGAVLLWSKLKTVAPTIAPPVTITGATPVAGITAAPSAPVTAGPPIEERPTPPNTPRSWVKLPARSLAATGVTAGDASQIAAAITGDPEATATFDTVPEGTPNGVGDSSINGMPTDGDKFGILTTGNVDDANTANTSAGTGTNLGGATPEGRGNTAYDVTVLNVPVTVAEGQNCLSIDFRFLSEEFPEYVGTTFNDGFVAELDSSTWTTSGSTITAPDNFAFDSNGDVVSVNSSGATAMNAANAAGTTYDGATSLLTAKTEITPGAHTLYLSIFDQGDHVYDSAAFIDRLIIGTTGDGGCERGAEPVEPPTSQTVNLRVTDDGSLANDTVNLFLRCPDAPDQPPIVLDVLVPVSEGGVATQTVNQGQPGCFIDAVVNDGFSSSARTEVAPSVVDNMGGPPTAAITIPTDNKKVLQYDNITFEGSGHSPKVTGGLLPGANLSWTSPTLFTGTKTGNSFTLSPPATGWVPGTYTVNLHAADGDGLGGDTAVHVEVLADNDHDGIPATVDTGCLAGGDTNPLNAGKDQDGDGFLSVNDMFLGTVDPFSTTAPCTPATAYLGQMLIFPTALDLASTSGTFAFSGVFVPNRNLRQIPTAGVKLSSIDGRPVSVPAVGWIMAGQLGGAAFSRQQLVAAVNSLGIHDRGVLVTLTGQATAGQLGATTSWRFDASATLLVK